MAGKLGDNRSMNKLFLDQIFVTQGCAISCHHFCHLLSDCNEIYSEIIFKQIFLLINKFSSKYVNCPKSFLFRLIKQCCDQRGLAGWFHTKLFCIWFEINLLPAPLCTLCIQVDWISSYILLSNCCSDIYYYVTR